MGIFDEMPIKERPQPVPANAEQIRTLVYGSSGTNVAQFSIDGTAAHFLTVHGHKFDVNIACGVRRMIDICEVNGVNLQLEALEPAPQVFDFAQPEPEPEPVEGPAPVEAQMVPVAAPQEVAPTPNRGGRPKKVA